jgi:cytochrome bd ubiquinol oxidase subunit I
LLDGKFPEHGRIFVRVGVIAGTIASIFMIFPTGDLHGKYVARHQPVTTAAMEGLWKTERGAPIVIIGQPDAEHQRIDNPIMVGRVLSFLIYGTTTAEVKGLNEFPRDQWPTNLTLLYYSYHIMAGLGTIFVAIMVTAAFLLWRRKLFQHRWILWAVMLATPFPFIANTAGWFTAELGRQPWLVYGLLRTAEGHSPHVSSGNSLFTLLGFMGMYALLSILYLFLTHREIAHGPGGDDERQTRAAKLTA